MAEYEITDIEFSPQDNDNWNVCEHCGRLVAYHLQEADGRMFCVDYTKRTEVVNPPESAAPTECDCPAKTCQPQSNVGYFCWRTGCPIYARDFPQHGEQQ